MCKKIENVWENNPELRPMAIANCKVCNLSLKMRDCKSCKFQFALKVIEAEKINTAYHKSLVPSKTKYDLAIEAHYYECQLLNG
jgi:hypothetical protein